jgi:hypothetical protein
MITVSFHFLKIEELLLLFGFCLFCFRKNSTRNRWSSPLWCFFLSVSSFFFLSIKMVYAFHSNVFYLLFFFSFIYFCFLSLTRFHYNFFLPDGLFLLSFFLSVCLWCMHAGMKRKLRTIKLDCSIAPF